MSFKNWEENDKIQFIGQKLIERGFKDWFLFFFKAIEKTSFVIEPIHQDLFDCFENIYTLKNIRQVINIPPRAGKTTLAIYFIAYCFAKNPACQFIYTSYSQELLGDNSRKLGAILQSNIYQQMYLQDFNVEEKTEKTIDSFWDEYYRNENKEFKITSRKITTNYGGCILFSSMGSQITGFGFSTRNSEGFSGCCLDYNEKILTDIGNLKIGDIVEKKIKAKCWTYNLKENKFELKEIENYIKFENKDLYEIELSNGKTIKCTEDHKFYVKNKGWVELKDLKNGDCIQSFSYSFNLAKRITSFFHNIFS